jgi:hypothetical protein
LHGLLAWLVVKGGLDDRHGTGAQSWLRQQRSCDQGD